MPEIRFKAFLSCSLAPEDREVITFFQRLISSFDIDGQIYDYQEIGRLAEKINERIVQSDCLIAIATRRTKIEGSNFWTCADWIHHEIALANAYKKPIAIFYEEGIKLEGLVAAEERKQAFTRADLIRDIDKITKFLFSLRSHLESAYRFDKLHIPVLIRHYLHIKEEMRSREVSIVRGEVLMECLADELEATHHSTELEETTPGLSVRPIQFDFLCKEAPAGVTVKPAVALDTDLRHVWRVVFQPPLRKGQKVKYAFKAVRQNTRPFTYEELIGRIDRGTYEYNEAICEACEWNIGYPTAEFAWEMEFPERYELQGIRLDVRMDPAGIRADGELKRIREGNLFSAEKIIDKWSLALRVPKPILGHTYYVYYVPPQGASVLSS